MGGNKLGGCDSTATLVLTINNTSTSSSTVTACDSYTWNELPTHIRNIYMGRNKLGRM